MILPWAYHIKGPSFLWKQVNFNVEIFFFFYIVSDAKNITFGPKQEGVSHVCGSLMETIRDFLSNMEEAENISKSQTQNNRTYSLASWVIYPPNVAYDKDKGGNNFPVEENSRDCEGICSQPLTAVLFMCLYHRHIMGPYTFLLRSEGRTCIIYYLICQHCSFFPYLYP